MCFSKISEGFLTVILFIKRIIVNVFMLSLLFSLLQFLLFPGDCHMLSQDKPTNERSHFNSKKLTESITHKYAMNLGFDITHKERQRCVLSV